MANISLNLEFVGSKQVTAAIAFLLALFSHILNHVVTRLRNALYEKENPNKLLHHEEEQATGREYILFENRASLKTISIFFLKKRVLKYESIYEKNYNIRDI